MLEGAFQNFTVKKIVSGAVRIVNQYINMGSVATRRAMVS
jgi:hypothetical protein